jgi:hypothetical protein
MAKLTAIVTTILGILLILPLLGITQLGTVTEGVSAWLLAIGVLVIGISKLIRNFSK